MYCLYYIYSNLNILYITIEQLYLQRILNICECNKNIFYFSELLKEPKKVNAGLQISPNNTVIEFTETFDNVEVWWPNGYGEQKLYAIHVDVVAYDTVFGAERAELSRSSKSVRVGFRKIELVQEKLSNGNSFYFKVNDLPIFMKGSNYIPSHILPEKSDNHERSL